MPLRLVVPAQQSNTALFAETRPKQIKTWLDTLPLVQLHDSARKVCDALARLNRVKLPAEERQKLVELYEPMLAKLQVELAEEYSIAPLPLPPASRQAVGLARGLLIEQAYAGKLALLERAVKLLLFGAKKQLLPLIEQIMRALAGTLAVSYQSYTPTPAGVWRELHELYRYVGEQSFVRFGPGAAPEPGAEGIDTAYKEALLLALADPYRLPRNELPLLADLTRELAPLVELQVGELPGAQQLFVIDPESDRPPKALAQLAAEAPGPNDWVVGTIPAVHRLSEVLIAREEEGRPVSGVEAFDSASVDLLQRLLRSWGAPPKRQYRRQTGHSSVEICAGVTRISRLLEAVDNARAQYAELQRHDIPVYKLPMFAESGVMQWEVINQSAAGLGLRCRLGEGAAIGVGEAVAVYYRGLEGFSIAAIRWAQTFEDGTVEFGLQMLSPAVEALQLEPVLASRGPIRALLLPQVASLRQAEMILAPRGTWREEAAFQLIQGRSIRTVDAAELVERTASFDLFCFRPL